MKKSQKILVGTGASVLALAAIAAVAGPIVYRELLTPPAAEMPAINGDERIMGAADGEPLTPDHLAGEWRVTDGSAAGYRVAEVLNGSDVVVTGRTPEVTGSFEISADGATLEAAALTVDVASISTESAGRDAFFRDQAMRVAEHPEANFALTEPVSLERIPAAGETVRATAGGELTLAGVTRAVTAEVEVRSDGLLTEIAGSVPITFADFGVDAPSLGFVTVEPDGQVEFQLVADRAVRGNAGSSR